MGVYASAYSVVVKNETVEIIYPGGLSGYAKDAPNATFCTDGHLSRIGFLNHNAVETFIEPLIELGFYASTDGGQDIAVVSQEEGVVSKTPWASYTCIDGVPVCYLTRSRPEPIAFPRHGSSEKLTYIDTGDICWYRFIEHADGLDEWEDIRSEKRHYMAVNSASDGVGMRGARLRYINDRLLVLVPEAEKARVNARDGLADWAVVVLEGLRKEAECLEKAGGTIHGHALYCAGLANRLLGHYEEATIYYRACLVTASENLSLLLELTLCLGKQGYADEAREIALQSVKVAPDSAEAWGNVAGSSLQLGLRDEARAALDRALDIAPDNVINRNLDTAFESFFPAEMTTAVCQSP